MWAKVLIEFVTILLLFYAMFSCFGYKACGMLAAQADTEPSPSASEGKVVATGLPPKSLCAFSSLPFVFCSRSFMSHIHLGDRHLIFNYMKGYLRVLFTNTQNILFIKPKQRNKQKHLMIFNRCLDIQSSLNTTVLHYPVFINLSEFPNLVITVCACFNLF